MASHELLPESEVFRAHRLNCKVCHHSDRFKIEQAREKKTTLPKISKQFGLTVSSLKRHFLALRTEENKLSDQKRVSIRDFCEGVINKCQENLQKSGVKVSIRDALNAATLLTKLGEGERIDEIWKAIEDGKADISTVTKELKVTKRINTVSGRD